MAVGSGMSGAGSMFRLKSHIGVAVGGCWLPYTNVDVCLFMMDPKDQPDRMISS